MAVSANVFQATIDQALQGKVNWATGTIKMGLLTATASPNLSTWVHWSDVTNETTGTGYSAGGVTLTSITHTETVASSWGTAWASGTTHVVGDIIKPLTPTSPDYLFVCVSTSGTGTTGGVEPTWPTTPGNTVVDNSGANQIIWSNLGESITVYSSANAQWTSSTFSAAYGVIYDASTGTASTEPLICLVNFGGTLSPSNGTLTVSPAATNGWFYSSPS